MNNLKESTKDEIQLEELIVDEELTKKSLLPTNDVIFHCLFGQIGSERITKDFIEKIINKEVENIDLDLNLNLIREKYDSKLGVLDVRARTQDGVNYNIEMQNTASTTLPERIMSYWSRLYNGDLKRGNNYDVLAKTIAILIVNDKIDRFKIIKKYHTKWNIREEDYQDVILTDDLEIHIIELPKYKEMKKKESYKNIWLDFIIEPEGEEVFRAMEKNEKIKEAKAKWKKITADDKIRDRALRLEIAELDRNTELKHAEKAGFEKGVEQGMKQGIEQGREEGQVKGEQNKSKDIAKKMKQKNISIKEIIEITGLTEEEIKDLQ